MMKILLILTCLIATLATVSPVSAVVVSRYSYTENYDSLTIIMLAILLFLIIFSYPAYNYGRRCGYFGYYPVYPSAHGYAPGYGYGHGYCGYGGGGYRSTTTTTTTAPSQSS